MGETRVIKLLVIEDSRAYLYLIQRAFKDRQGDVRWELTVAETGDQAVRMLFAEEDKNAPLPDLILLDWTLPGISGGEVLQRIKSHPRLLRIPVLVFSSSDADILAAYNGHANGYITKPADMDVLAATVETIERFCLAVQLPKVARGSTLG